MIEAKDLRIGNWVSIIRPENDCVVKGKIECLFRTICDIDGSNFNYQWLSGIPLTPELLEKCGFEKNKFYNTYTIKLLTGGYYSLHKADECDIKEGLKTWIFNNSYSDAGCYFIADLEYLHQLQNLYYALTGQELTVNL